MDITNLLEQFPKIRPNLETGQLEIYESEYLANREGHNLMSNIAQKLESWMHIKVAEVTNGEEVLEIGAGSLNHLNYIVDKVSKIDVIEPMSSLYQNSPKKDLVRNFYNDINECNNNYDTIYSVAALEHITDLPAAIAKAGIMLKPRANFINGIPCERGFLWGLLWRITTGLSYKLRTGYSYKKLMRYEHVNNFDEIISLLRYFFKEIDLQYFIIPSKHFALYAVINAKQPDLKRCMDYLVK